ncbi:MAG TPA: hypothetical protein VHE81_15415 [Lacipirellulaceae bacterium]|nr:hypothetical protein [Lacipirellulaceae bacterium]
MQLGKTLVGAIIGAILGIALLVAVYFLFAIDKMWMAIPVAILTGLGVRLAIEKIGRPSYLRGALTVILAMAAYLGGLMITRAVANRQAAMTSKPSLQNKAAQTSNKSDTKASDTQPAGPAEQADAPGILTGNEGKMMRQPALPSHFSPWDFISLAVAALIAYELGRGTETVPRNTEPSAPSESIPAEAHPDA